MVRQYTHTHTHQSQQQTRSTELRRPVRVSSFRRLLLLGLEQFFAASCCMNGFVVRSPRWTASALDPRRLLSRRSTAIGCGIGRTKKGNSSSQTASSCCSRPPIKDQTLQGNSSIVSTDASAASLGASVVTRQVARWCGVKMMQHADVPRRLLHRARAGKDLTHYLSWLRKTSDVPRCVTSRLRFASSTGPVRHCCRRTKAVDSGLNSRQAKCLFVSRFPTGGWTSQICCSNRTIQFKASSFKADLITLLFSQKCR